MEVVAAFVIAFAFLTTITPLRDVPDSEITLTNVNGGIVQNLKFDVRPFSEFKDQSIVKQKFDYSCGSAALATLLNYYLGEKLTEQQVIQGLMEYGDSKLIEERRAFSLLDMKQFVAVLGYQGTGYTAELDDLRTLGKPCIVPIEFFGYKHFVVFKGMYKDHMFFADPYMGNISFPIAEFQKMWHKNILFLVTTQEATLSALRLKDEDLRIVDFDWARDTYLQEARSKITDNENRFKETIGRTDTSTPRKYQFMDININ
jgi:uncharacterized protein